MLGNQKLVMIVAGEASGDVHGSNLVRAMKRLDPGLTFLGMGGKHMEDAGVNILISSSDIAVVGLTEVMARLYTIARAHFKLKSLLKNSRPALIILIDFPDFNINLARSAKRFKTPVLYYISPQIWAWRRGRVKKMAKRVDRIAVILPFEKEVYLESGMDVEYVGHPLLDSITVGVDKSNVIQDMGLTGGCPIVGLLPGSRSEEVKKLLPVMIEAVEILCSHYPDIRCVLALAPTISADLIESLISQSTIEITISQKDIYNTLRACDLALVTSGTATLETAIMGVPMVIAYRVSLVTYVVGKMVVKVPYIGLVNLVAGEQVVPELIQDEVTPQRLCDEALAILENEQRKQDMRRKLHMVRERLGRGGASERTARIALEMMRSTA